MRRFLALYGGFACFEPDAFDGLQYVSLIGIALDACSLFVKGHFNMFYTGNFRYGFPDVCCTVIAVHTFYIIYYTGRHLGLAMMMMMVAAGKSIQQEH